MRRLHRLLVDGGAYPGAVLCTTDSAVAVGAVVRVTLRHVWIEIELPAASSAAASAAGGASSSFFAPISAAPVGDSEGHAGVPATRTIIVEPHLREHFAISRSSPAYGRLLASLPPIFVGSPARLALLVGAMVDAMAASFASVGLDMPPWRQLKVGGDFKCDEACMPSK